MKGGKKSFTNPPDRKHGTVMKNVQKGYLIVFFSQNKKKLAEGCNAEISFRHDTPCVSYRGARVFGEWDIKSGIRGHK